MIEEGKPLSLIPPRKVGLFRTDSGKQLSYCQVVKTAILSYIEGRQVKPKGLHTADDRSYGIVSKAPRSNCVQ
jgi:hypothetical protein